MSATQKTVIVAEDEPLVRMLAAESLTDAGFTVIEVGHADEALAALKAHKGQVLALFTDVHMPGTHNGLELAQLVYEKWPRVALIVTSGHYVLSEGEMPNGGIFVTKPYELEAIIAQLKTVALISHF